MAHFYKLALVALLFAGCTTPAPEVGNTPAASDRTRKQVDLPPVNWTEGETSVENAPTKGEFLVKFETTAGDFTMKAHRDWAPLGAERFYRLIENKYFDGAPFYRVVPGFMVQFGMCGDPKGTKYWGKTFDDEKVKQSNMPGKVSYAKAGPNSRSTQLFINYGNNGSLDLQHFAPFAEVIEGMDKVQGISSEYGQRPNQGSMTLSGNKYVFKDFPNIDYIIQATFVDETEIAGDVENSDDAE